ncbi:uncharacterized protein LOC129591034 [Paramacrobiotus metropolitanus]|uniref:uncharacterized protein LOC129591034 n=1 Tax=Paramacrobiotus metropolitanus TaxID=2943436 RepID=UPI002445742F|nr:uncharacterized protein LOC129591034 [Paramacrobiotus metropolitanus]
MRNSSVLILLLGLTILIVPDEVRCNNNYAKDDQGPYPHPACSYSRQNENDPLLLSCPSGMVIPGNFDAAQIRKDVQIIVINGGGSPNILASNAPPLPADLTALQHLRLNSFTDENNSSIRIKRFVENVKDRLQFLVVQSSKVGSLEDGFLQGFSQLRQLDFMSSDISVISKTAFQRNGTAPRLNISLTWNRLESLDWAVFQPITEIGSLDLSSQRPGLHSISCSTNFRLPAETGHLLLRNNNLEFLPHCVIDSLNYQDGHMQLDVDNNPFCPTDDKCACSAMEPFFRFICDYTTRDQVYGVTWWCGTAPNQTLWHAQQLPPTVTCTNSGRWRLRTNWWLLIITALMFCAFRGDTGPCMAAI